MIDFIIEAETKTLFLKIKNGLEETKYKREKFSSEEFKTVTIIWYIQDQESKKYTKLNKILSDFLEDEYKKRNKI